MRAVLVIVAAAGMLSAGLALAQSGADVVKAKGCLNCHDVDKKKAGPSFKDSAAKHKGKKDASAMLVGKLKEGKGHPKAAATDAELKAAVDYVLSVK